MYICHIPYAIFDSTSDFSFKICIKLQCIRHNWWHWSLMQILKFLMSVLKWQVNSASNFALFFIAIPFLLWTKGTHQSSNFYTFKCPGENLANLSCLFSNHWSVFLQNMHNSSESWKITPLYSCISNNIYFGYKEPIKTKNFIDFRVLRSTFVKFLM